MAKKKIETVVVPLETQKATVEVEAEVPAHLVENKSAPATTTAQEDLVTLRQSRINFIWEFTQGGMALSLIWTICYCMANGIKIETEFWILISMVASTYYQRTNHKTIGGVGYKPPNETR